MKVKFEERELPDEGTQVGVCIQVIDLGTQLNKKYGNKSRKILITWELTDNNMKSGEPFIISRRYTASLGPQSHLRPALEAWLGKKLTPEEIQEGFELKSLLGKTANLTIAHDHRETQTYANIVGVGGLSKRFQEMYEHYKIHNPLRHFDLDDPDWDMFKSFPEWMKKIIMESPEFKKARGIEVVEEEPEEMPDIPDFDPEDVRDLVDKINRDLYPEPD